MIGKQSDDAAKELKAIAGEIAPPSRFPQDPAQSLKEIAGQVEPQPNRPSLAERHAEIQRELRIADPDGNPTPGTYRFKFVLGLVIFLIGLFATIASYTQNDGRSVTIFGGALLIGLIMMAIGAVGYYNDR